MMKIWIACMAAVLIATVSPARAAPGARADAPGGDRFLVRGKAGYTQVSGQDTYPRRGSLDGFTAALDVAWSPMEVLQLLANYTHVFNSATSHLAQVSGGPAAVWKSGPASLYGGVLLGMYIYHQGDIINPLFPLSPERFDVSRFAVMPTAGVDFALTDRFFVNASVQYMKVTESGNGLANLNLLAGVGTSF